MIVFKDSLDELIPENLIGFFDGWLNPPSHERLYEILNNSSNILLAVDEDTGNVIGFINALSDGVLSAYIPLLEVKRNYQGRGIGEELARRMVRTLKEHYMIDVICDESLITFYEKIGMKRSTGMIIRNYERQTGKQYG